MAAPSAMKVFANNLDIWNTATIAGASPKMALLTSTAGFAPALVSEMRPETGAASVGGGVASFAYTLASSSAIVSAQGEAPDLASGRLLDPTPAAVETSGGVAALVASIGSATGPVVYAGFAPGINQGLPPPSLGIYEASMRMENRELIIPAETREAMLPIS